MTILTTPGFPDYTLLDSGDGYRLEKVGRFLLKRPDPQALWQSALHASEWGKADAVFTVQKGAWQTNTALPESWIVQYKKLQLKARLTPFKHTGIFPEQHLHWDWLHNLISNAQRPPRILNLFAYTGAASIISAASGGHVTHVDASKPAITWAKENQSLSNLTDKPIRWMLDDCLKFVEREYRRGVHYDGIIMDPPVYGHGPDGKTWDFHHHFPELLTKCLLLMSPKPLFLLINAYAISASAIMLENMLTQSTTHLKGDITAGELCLEESTERRFLLSTGIFARWTSTSFE